MISNLEIAEAFELLGKLMELHGENPFKAKSYSSAAYNIEKLDAQLDGMDSETMGNIAGIGTAIREKILTLIETGHIKLLDDLIAKTPTGVLEMMNIKGLGPKKVSQLWRELGIESIGELQYACNENRLTLLKGFGEKTQASVLKNLEFYLSKKGFYRYAEIEQLAESLVEFFSIQLQCTVSLTGPVRRKAEVMEQIDLLMQMPEEKKLHSALQQGNLKIEDEQENFISILTESKVKVNLHWYKADEFASQLFITTGSNEFVQSLISKMQNDDWKFAKTEEEIFQLATIDFVEPVLRENSCDSILHQQELIQFSHIKGVVHAHSTWSDGRCTVEEMAKECIRLGYEYLCMSDHSQSAFYAQGLSPEKILNQWEEIDALNKKLEPFRIFKGIESDILFDGSLDYEDELLSRFDFVIASVHSQFKMSETKATERILTAIKNPYTTILGHPTGRLLLSREGYPVDMHAVIDACATHGVIIELNAHPWRLDIDWRLIKEATGKGVKISINPDAHNLTGIGDIRFGTYAAQKGGLKIYETFNALNLSEVKKYFETRKKLINQSA